MTTTNARRRRASAPARSVQHTRTRNSRGASSTRFPRRLFGLFACVTVVIALAYWHTLLTATTIQAPPAVRPARYVTVLGDTPASVGSMFTTSPELIAQQGGVANSHSPLPVGTTVHIDAMQLWEQMNRDNTAPFAALVEQEARRQGVEQALALAVAWQESRLDQRARSATGAIGIMQVEPDTATLAARDLGQPVNAAIASDNVVAGIFWLHSLLSSYGGDRSSALAAYYEGPGNLARRGYLTGTREYVARALQIRQILLLANPDLRG